MTRFGFVLDQRTCIGCHACTVACKQEHGVELGVFRTWVKYIEEGTFPDTQRYFSVLRCNHCDDAPCVEICPVTALFRREDGIVDFDPERCIGCKACMNACPYDALYIDPHSHTAAKCNFCAHRVDQGLKPSCEIVCPTHAIVSGDIDDPDSEISQLITTVPSARARAGTGHAAQGVLPGGAGGVARPAGRRTAQAAAQRVLRGGAGAARHPGRRGGASVVADASHHPPPWGWRVSSYFLSKGVAAGAMMLAVLLLLVGARGSALADVVPGVMALAGIALTGVLLVSDLKRPDRFHYLFLRPQWRSWLALGAQVINLAAVAALAFTVAAIVGADGVRDVLRWIMVPAGAALAGYTALLFNQCEGRDLWQSRLLLPHTIVNAVLAGSGALAVAALFGSPPGALERALGWSLVGGAAAGAALIALDTFGTHSTRQAARAARNLWRDLYAARFWAGVGLATLLPAILGAAFLAAGGAGLLAGAGAAALIGLWFYEDAWVRAGQSVPLS